MGRRAYKRLRIALPVSISGLDASGNIFKQTATTVEIGARGMRLRDVYCLRARGEHVHVEYKHRQAEFRVAWIGESGGTVGLEGLEDARFLFAQHLPEDVDALPHPELDSYRALDKAVAVESAPVEALHPKQPQQERRQQERRRDVRYPCAGTANIWENGMQGAISCRMNEISRGGCYIETMSPARCGTPLRLELAVNGRIIRVEGLVRYSQLSYGMGVEFTKIELPEAEKLDRVIKELGGEQAVEEPPPAPVAAPPMEAPSGKVLGEAVERWFGTHDVLTRADFLKIVEELKSRALRNASSH